MLPGGLGAREIVLKEMLEPQYGEVLSTVAPIFLRLVIIASELIVAPILYLTLRKDSRQDDAVGGREG